MNTQNTQPEIKLTEAELAEIMAKREAQKTDEEKKQERAYNSALASVKRDADQHKVSSKRANDMYNSFSEEGKKYFKLVNTAVNVYCPEYYSKEMADDVVRPYERVLVDKLYYDIDGLRNTSRIRIDRNKNGNCIMDLDSDIYGDYTSRKFVARTVEVKIAEWIKRVERKKIAKEMLENSEVRVQKEILEKSPKGTEVTLEDGYTSHSRHSGKHGGYTWRKLVVKYPNGNRIDFRISTNGDLSRVQVINAKTNKFDNEQWMEYLSK